MRDHRTAIALLLTVTLNSEAMSAPYGYSDCPDMAGYGYKEKYGFLRDPSSIQKVEGWTLPGSAQDWNSKIDKQKTLAMLIKSIPNSGTSPRFTCVNAVWCKENINGGMFSIGTFGNYGDDNRLPAKDGTITSVRLQQDGWTDHGAHHYLEREVVTCRERVVRVFSIYYSRPIGNFSIQPEDVRWLFVKTGKTNADLEIIRYETPPSF